LSLVFLEPSKKPGSSLNSMLFSSRHYLTSNIYGNWMCGKSLTLRERCFSLFGPAPRNQPMEKIGISRDTSSHFITVVMKNRLPVLQTDAIYDHLLGAG
jgi:hypothetical protein